MILELGSYPVQTGDELYEAACEIDWPAHVPEGRSLMVDSRVGVATYATAIWGAAFKDAIVDQHRAKGRARPTVDVKSPDIRIHARLSKGISAWESISVVKAFIGEDIDSTADWPR